MATHTTHYNLTKPSLNDKVNIGVLNDNADIIDNALYNKVIPNPTGETTDTLTALEIDGTKYSLGGGNKITYLTHGQIGQGDPPEYITNCPLDVNLSAGVAIAITITDGNNKYSAVQYYSGGEIVYTVGQFNLYVYNDHISLPNYSGSYRNIYCDIIGI